MVIKCPLCGKKAKFKHWKYVQRRYVHRFWHTKPCEIKYFDTWERTSLLSADFSVCSLCKEPIRF